MRKFELEHRVGYAETDAMAIVHHSNYIRWFEMGRNDLLRTIGYPYSEMERMGIWMPVTRVSCQYKSPSIFDEVVIIRSWIDQLKGASVSLAYDVIGKEKGDLKVTGSSRHGFTDPDLVPIRLKREFPALYEKLAGAAK